MVKPAGWIEVMANEDDETGYMAVQVSHIVTVAQPGKDVLITLDTGVTITLKNERMSVIMDDISLAGIEIR